MATAAAVPGVGAHAKHHWGIANSASSVGGAQWGSPRAWVAPDQPSRFQKPLRSLATTGPARPDGLKDRNRRASSGGAGHPLGPAERTAPSTSANQRLLRSQGMAGCCPPPGQSRSVGAQGGVAAEVGGLMQQLEFPAGQGQGHNWSTPSRSGRQSSGPGAGRSGRLRGALDAIPLRLEQPLRFNPGWSDPGARGCGHVMERPRHPRWPGGRSHRRRRRTHGPGSADSSSRGVFAGLLLRGRSPHQGGVLVRVVAAPPIEPPTNSTGPAGLGFSPHQLGGEGVSGWRSGSTNRPIGLQESLFATPLRTRLGNSFAKLARSAELDARRCLRAIENPPYDIHKLGDGRPCGSRRGASARWMTRSASWPPTCW